jgi:tetratricopeptide (TPR) repeat protein
MRRLLIAFALVAVVGSAHADQRDPQLTRLFNQLATVRTLPEAADLEAQITAIWMRSGSDTVDVLMARAQTAVEVQDIATAKKLLDSVIEMKPAFAEVWFRRAELFIAMDSQEEAAADLAKTLELEKRHFKALVLVGRLADAAGDKRAALDAYRRAVAINPMLEAIARRAGQLAVEAERKPPT